MKVLLGPFEPLATWMIKKYYTRMDVPEHLKCTSQNKCEKTFNQELIKIRTLYSQNKINKKEFEEKCELAKYHCLCKANCLPNNDMDRFAYLERIYGKKRDAKWIKTIKPGNIKHNEQGDRDVFFYYKIENKFIKTIGKVPRNFVAKQASKKKFRRGLFSQNPSNLENIRGNNVPKSLQGHSIDAKLLKEQRENTTFPRNTKSLKDKERT
ncbi:MAG: hypothetical protein PHI90_02400 [Clostridia bacterium]|nr:hypothetical protein [Clostridia bacterium]MDD4047671.1 hypothetical protein [Clostridia bacterium]